MRENLSKEALEALGEIKNTLLRTEGRLLGLTIAIGSLDPRDISLDGIAKAVAAAETDLISAIQALDKLKEE